MAKPSKELGLRIQKDQEYAAWQNDYACEPQEIIVTDGQTDWLWLPECQDWQKIEN